MGIYVKQEYLNKTEGYSFGDSGVYESRFEKVEEVFKFCQKEYGRCLSRVYVDGENGVPFAIGWVFERVDKYEDTGENYIKETWVSLHEKEPEKTIKHFYKKL